MKNFFAATMRFLRWLWPRIVVVCLWLARVPGRLARWLRRHREWVLTGMAMVVVMLVSAALTLRVALHVREVMVPDFSGMTLAEAGQAAVHAGVDLSVENRFYSTTVPAGRVLSQAPGPDSSVRHGWMVRVTESLGPQQVTIPDVAGEPLRDAAMDLRRKQLDLGMQARLAAPGDPDMVLAQTPPPNAGVDQPRVNLLLSTQAEAGASGFVMPSFAGMSSSAAIRAASELGLVVSGAGTGPTVTSQSPQAGSRAARGGSVRIMLSGGSSLAPAASAPDAPADTPRP